MDTQALTVMLKQRARELGFQLAGVCPATGPAGLARFRRWLDAGYAGEMHYLWTRARAYEHPRHVLPGVRSILMLAMIYRTTPPAPAMLGEGRASTYAWGSIDYHELIRARLAVLAEYLHDHVPPAKVRGVVDTAPLMERELARHAGLGWIGKNTLLLSREAGSWFFLAALLTDVELAYDAPHQADHCGSCRACLDACPTRAFPQPYVLDASRCISYLTIELKGPIPTALRAPLGTWLFGCDVCQEVCPWNRRPPRSAEPQLMPAAGMNPVDLGGLFRLDDDTFRRRFRRSPLSRPGRRGILRNAAIALGNRPSRAHMPALLRGLSDHQPLVRAACAWALGRCQDPAARAAIAARRQTETDAQVVREIDAALA